MKPQVRTRKTHASSKAAVVLPNGWELKFHLSQTLGLANAGENEKKTLRRRYEEIERLTGELRKKIGKVATVARFVRNALNANPENRASLSLLRAIEGCEKLAAAYAKELQVGFPMGQYFAEWTMLDERKVEPALDSANRLISNLNKIIQMHDAVVTASYEEEPKAASDRD